MTDVVPRLVGTPTPKTWPNVEKLDHYNAFPRFPARDIAAHASLAHLPADARDFIKVRRSGTRARPRG